jgi:hypothetical protein
MWERVGKGSGGTGYTPTGPHYRDERTEGRVGHCSKIKVCSYPSQQHDTDCQSDQGVHIEMVALVEGRTAVSVCLVQVQVATAFSLGEDQDQWY